MVPKIDREVEKLLDGCLACQANGPNTKPAPLQMSPLPPTPWHTVHIDFCGPFPTGEYLLVVIDAYSRFPEVDIIHSTSAKGTIYFQIRLYFCYTWRTLSSSAVTTDLLSQAVNMNPTCPS